MKQGSLGFSLLELLVAVSIMMIIATAGVTTYTNLTKKSRDARRSSDIEQIRQALEIYKSDHGYYPAVNTSSFGDVANLGGVLVSTYLPKVPVDPKNNVYQYYAKNSDGGTPAKYYGYCVAVLGETSELSGNTCKQDDGSPLNLPNTYTYGLAQP